MSDFGFREASGRSSVWLWIEGIEDQRRIALAHFVLVRCLHLTPSACVCETERRNVILDVGFCEQQAMALDAIVAEQLLAEARRFLTAEASSAEQPADARAFPARLRQVHRAHEAPHRHHQGEA